MENDDEMLMEFFRKLQSECIYTKFAEQNHEIFVEVMCEFKKFAKEMFESRANGLMKLFGGDQNLVNPATDLLKAELDSLLPDIIKTHAWFLVEEIKKHADTMLIATKDASKQFIKH